MCDISRREFYSSKPYGNRSALLWRTAHPRRQRFESSPSEQC